MSELSQILQKEQDNKEMLDKVKQAVNKEIEAKKQELDHKLNQTSLLSDEKKNKVLSYKKQKIESINKEQEVELETKLVELERKKNKSMNKAVDVVIEELLA